MARTVGCLFVLLVCLLGQAGGKQLACENDLRAVVIMIRQVKTETHDTMVSMRKEFASIKKEMVTQRTVMAAQQTKMTSMEETIESQNTVMTAQQTKMTSMEQTIESQNTVMTAQQTKMTSMEEKIESQSTEVAALVAQKAAGFSVNDIKEVSSSKVMLFEDSITNIDQSYNMTTGVFTCKIRGYYYFSTTLLKTAYNENHAYCAIRKNSDRLVEAYTSLDDKGNTVAVASTYVFLAVGDTVTLADCTETGSWHLNFGTSFFSGFLVTHV